MLPYAVAVVSVAVLAAVAALLFAQPRRARMAIDEVIVIEGKPSAAAKEPAPGDVLEAVLTGEGGSGDGSVKIGGLMVYVAGGRRGERVRFRILEVKTSRKGNRYAKAELIGSGADGAPTGEVAP